MTSWFSFFNLFSKHVCMAFFYYYLYINLVSILFIYEILNVILMKILLCSLNHDYLLSLHINISTQYEVLSEGDLKCTYLLYISFEKKKKKWR